MSQLSVTAVGVVGTEPNHIRTAEGTEVTSFRLAVTERRFDEKQRSWVDGDTSWVTVVSYRQLAVNIAASMHKSDRVLVTGRLRLREWQDEKGRSGTTADILADAVGHELLWGTSTYTRLRRSDAVAPAAEPGDARPAPEAGDWGAPAPTAAELPF